MEKDDKYKLFTISEAARRLNLSRNLVYDLLNSNRLGSIIIGKRRMIPEKSLMKLIDTQSFNSESLPVYDLSLLKKIEKVKSQESKTKILLNEIIRRTKNGISKKAG